jgi:hypothetical protein
MQESATMAHLVITQRKRSVVDPAYDTLVVVQTFGVLAGQTSWQQVEGAIEARHSQHRWA